ncbi:stress responsive alpha-beta barrel domain protein Dabb [Lachnospiraceae bacterium KM106-2]|nr:stress responsive alpha-beta barrel domain protein Dabb [Lachnospiraceae bacterium KM106-2]
MIRHVVMFDFAKEADGKTAIENAVIARDGLLALPEKLEYIKHMEVGINDSEADSANYTLCLIVDFDTMEDLQAYAVDPEHLKVAAFIGKVKIGRSCVDFEI